MNVIEALALAVAAFFAGGINAVAGGGTLITFPALVAVGYPAKIANVTNTVALWPGTVSASSAYLPEISRQRETIKVIALPTIAGGIAGSVLLLSTSNRAFEAVVPFLILGACSLLFLQSRIVKLVVTDSIQVETRSKWPLRIGVFLASVYGGYFGAGLGIILLALFGVFLDEDIQHANGLRNLIAMAVNGIASGYFAIFGDVVWEAALIMAAMSMIGGFAGAKVARRMPAERLRRVAVTYGTIAALVLLLR